MYVPQEIVDDSIQIIQQTHCIQHITAIPGRVDTEHTDGLFMTCYLTDLTCL